MEFYRNSAIARLPFDVQPSTKTIDGFNSTDGRIMAPPYDKSGNNYFKMVLVESPPHQEIPPPEYQSRDPSPLSCGQTNVTNTRPTSLTISGPTDTLPLSISTPELIGMLGGDDLTYGHVIEKVGNDFELPTEIDSKSLKPPTNNREQDLTSSLNDFARTEVHHSPGHPGSSSLLQGGAQDSNPVQGISAIRYPEISELPQTVPVGPGPTMTPINMEKQELIKTERKRMRNRLAASKCRKRKLERISRLEEKVSDLKRQNIELSSNANLLRQQVAELKSKVLSHVNSGCSMLTAQLAF